MVSKRLTRARVDGWTCEAGWRSRCWAHPCARGWLDVPAEGEVARPRLTRARVDGWPTAHHGAVAAIGLTRARVDGWALYPRRDAAKDGSPVRAWMAGPRTARSARRRRLTRARVDGWSAMDLVKPGSSAHPCARGWLVVREALRLGCSGSPVRAWMAGYVAGFRAWLTRLTRARVDGWGAVSGPTVVVMAHPCARGWLVVFTAMRARQAGLTRARVDGWVLAVRRLASSSANLLGKYANN